MWLPDSIKHSLIERMQFGREKYGHGLRSSMDTRQWGTKDDSWLEMAAEEYLDAIMYILTDYIRVTGSGDEKDDTPTLLELMNNPLSQIKIKFHADTLRATVDLLQNLLRCHQHRSQVHK